MLNSFELNGSITQCCGHNMVDTQANTRKKKKKKNAQVSSRGPQINNKSLTD